MPCMPPLSKPTMAAKSAALSEAPPMSPPSISGIAISCLQLPAFMEPPYWMRTFSAHLGQNTSAHFLRM